MTRDPARVARLYEIAAFERPLTPVERIEAGLAAPIDVVHVARLYEIAAFERPLSDVELVELDLDGAAA